MYYDLLFCRRKLFSSNGFRQLAAYFGEFYEEIWPPGSWFLDVLIEASLFCSVTVVNPAY